MEKEGIMAQEQIKILEVYKSLWKCRDLEIQMLWTRLTLLGAFMALTYAGYGALILKGLDGIKNWGAFNLAAIGASAFGLLFSILWTTTAKGSKAWFERYEAMLAYSQKTFKEHDLFECVADEELILSYLDFDKRCIRRHLQPVDSNLLSQNAGAYSVSKIPIVMGQVSMVAWGVIGLAHFIVCVAGRSCTRNFVQGSNLHVLALLMIGAVAVGSLVICWCVESSALEKK